MIVALSIECSISTLIFFFSRSVAERMRSLLDYPLAATGLAPGLSNWSVSGSLTAVGGPCALQECDAKQLPLLWSTRVGFAFLHRSNGRASRATSNRNET